MKLCNTNFNKEKIILENEKEKICGIKIYILLKTVMKKTTKKHVKITVIRETLLALNKKKTYLWNKHEQYYKQLSENTNNCEFF
ncbi:hypothetical protein [Zunongwangia pacifica]|uniref:Uncharacterized protein n=1 Tax=Zunongwangia pacifica TaxID=2911062 RepID=A0A9X2CLX0_9FLAO|nr:hypothetical protein [Zunongwangia pacifica]MCL6220501.1 hypothetical protein [Zunongwangia pacifica]